MSPSTSTLAFDGKDFYSVIRNATSSVYITSCLQPSRLLTHVLTSQSRVCALYFTASVFLRRIQHPLCFWVADQFESLLIVRIRHLVSTLVKASHSCTAVFQNKKCQTGLSSFCQHGKEMQTPHFSGRPCHFLSLLAPQISHLWHFWRTSFWRVIIDNRKRKIPYYSI